MISGWGKRYFSILKELNYSEKKDKESALILDSILKKTDTIEKIKKLIEGKTIFVIGSGPSLSIAIPKLKKLEKSIKIAADSSLEPLIDNGIIPDIIVTDLDGNKDTIKKISKTKSIFVIHAHGDNIEKLQMVKKMKTWRRTLQDNLSQVFLMLALFFNPFGFDAVQYSLMLWTGSLWKANFILYCVVELF